MPKKVLIIESDMVSADIIGKILESDGYEICVAKNGEEGLLKVSQGGLALVIINVVLPDINGVEVCREVKAKLGKDAPKVVMLTGVIDAIDAVAARRAGADDFCVKTGDMSNLVEAIKKII